jgi:hypothetical protein
MLSLRQLAKDDVVIGGVSQANLSLAAKILGRYSRRLKHPVWRWFYRYRSRALDVELTAAAFARVDGVPEPLPDQFDAQVRAAMRSDDERR